MNTWESFDPFVQQVRRACGPNARYRTLWLVGEPRSGKSRFCQAVCERTGWAYLNHTMDPSGLPALAGQEGIYTPQQFVAWLQTTAQALRTEILVVDEIEPMLGWWSYEEQGYFLRTVSWAKGLPAGVVLVTRLRSAVARLQMADGVPNDDHLFKFKEAVQ